MKKLPFVLAALLLIVSTACSKRYPYTCYCKTYESTGFGEPIGESFPKAKKEKAEETCEIFSNSERTCSPIFAK
ncbi:hypothetical protein [Fluviicola taffensis]|jgi:hypothetical protein|uniref:Lipoprotein n=1 Tax=Fluviicola taffensis (strain DSM 16823 / NCIMB 13979 / RW262) TaxID=755732 RepID=F2IF29_FLUTR|nr:hypothetical protein [Fluviicola taffensis]AEA43503.1 hypothetical protein Fluta_1509 [Fluviicola taffensis DSM 16823]